MQTKLPRKKADASPRTFRSRVERQLSWAAVEGERFQHRDPLDQVTERFQQTFDQMGRRRAEELEPAVPREGEQPRRPRLKDQAAKFHPEMPQTPIRAFAGMAFQRGRLASAVLQGTGRMMLATCLQHAVGQHNLLQSRQTLFGAGSQVRVVPGSAPDQMVFHRGFARSAVGLVVDVLSDARSVVDTLAEMASGTGPLEENEGAQTLRQVYPFLDDSRERQLLEQYRAQLAGTAGVEERQVLQNALVHTGALIARKAQMKQAFVARLRLLSDKAQEALEELQQEDTLDFLAAAAAGAALAVLPEEPPEQPPPPKDKPGGRKPAAPALNQKEAPPHGTQQPDGTDHPEGNQPDPGPAPEPGAGPTV